MWMRREVESLKAESQGSALRSNLGLVDHDWRDLCFQITSAQPPSLGFAMDWSPAGKLNGGEFLSVGGLLQERHPRTIAQLGSSVSI